MSSEGDTLPIKSEAIETGAIANRRDSIKIPRTKVQRWRTKNQGPKTKKFLKGSSFCGRVQRLEWATTRTCSFTTINKFRRCWKKMDRLRGNYSLTSYSQLLSRKSRRMSWMNRCILGRSVTKPERLKLFLSSSKKKRQRSRSKRINYRQRKLRTL